MIRLPPLTLDAALKERYAGRPEALAEVRACERARQQLIEMSRNESPLTPSKEA